MPYYILKSYKLNFKPVKIFEVLSREKNCFYLDSSLNPALPKGTRYNIGRKSGVNSDYSSGRFSLLGIEPFLILNTKDRDPFKKLREYLDLYSISLPKSPIPFAGGGVGYLAYDLGLILEKKIKTRVKEELLIPHCFFGFYNTVVIIDHLMRMLYIFASGLPEASGRLGKLLAESNFRRIHNLISKAGNTDGKFILNAPRKSALKDARLSSNFTKEGYLSAVKKAKEYIKAGDIYQVNLSQQFNAQTGLSAFEIYQRLRKISPSHFSAYFDAGDFQILSSSPERFLSLEGDLVITRPMKGTRPRAKNKLQDKKFKDDLLKSAKDKAELVMIVDLERNDLGRVCDYNSIRVNTLRRLERYSTVFQTTATVCGRLHKDKDRIDLLRACFPGGSITGCPKIRAMEIIEELEPLRRSIYTGSLGYLSFCGNMDFNILIRTILKQGNQLHFGVGGGIVADSRPQDEYKETLVKARAMIEAITC